MRTVLVSLPSGAGVVREDGGSTVVTNDAHRGGSGTFLRDDDKFHPEKTWIDEGRCVVGGLLPPGAVSAEVVDDRGRRIAASVAHGAYAALLEQPNDGHEPIVCCRDSAGSPVRRLWAADYPRVRVTDAEEPCPACGAIDYDEYTPFEHWRGGRLARHGATVANPVVSCRVCGHEEPEGGFVRVGSDYPEEDEAPRVVRARAQQRQRRWQSAARTLAGTKFPIYGAEGWPARLGGSGSRDGQCTEITVNHYDAHDADPYAGDQPRLTVTTELDGGYPSQALEEARSTLEDWVSRDEQATRWPDTSRAAITLWLRARARERRATVLDAVRSEQRLTVDDAPTTALMLSTPNRRWVAVARHADLTIIVAAHSVESASISLRPIADPVPELLGPEAPRQ